MKYNNGSYYFVKDLFGNIKEIREGGTKVAEYEYDTWGNCTVLYNNTANIADINPFRYRGYYMDTETGYYYLQTRYYDPALRRFISSDSYDLIPTLAESGDLNLYTYCGNNPVMFVDPTGHWLETLFDLLSLGFSVVEVVINPFDPLNWMGLAGDAIDLIPFVTGVGETIKGMKVVAKGVDLSDDTLDTIRFVKATTMLDDFSDLGLDLKKVGNAYNYHKFTKSNHVDGTVLHSLFMGNGGRIKGTKLRYDGLRANTLFELKPYNRRNVRRAVKQILQYNDALGGGYKMIIVLY